MCDTIHIQLLIFLSTDSEVVKNDEYKILCRLLDLAILLRRLKKAIVNTFIEQTRFELRNAGDGERKINLHIELFVRT